MTDLRDADLSKIRDQDMTPEQRSELQRRLRAFAKAHVRAGRSPAPRARKTIRKWTPKGRAD
jgi:hypothetical protein